MTPLLSEAEKKRRRAEANRRCYLAKRDEYMAKCKARQKTDKGKTYHRDYARRRSQTDPMFRLRKNLRVRLCTALRLEYKSGSAVADLGCSVDEFRTYISSLFKDGMSWDNYGEWEIDHIVPLSSFDLSSRDELLKAVNFSNLQPLWKHENRVKSNKT